jgi:hypothetical protein
MFTWSAFNISAIIHSDRQNYGQSILNIERSSHLGCLNISSSNSINTWIIRVPRENMTCIYIEWYYNVIINPGPSVRDVHVLVRLRRVSLSPGRCDTTQLYREGKRVKCGALLNGRSAWTRPSAVHRSSCLLLLDFVYEMRFSCTFCVARIFYLFNIIFYRRSHQQDRHPLRRYQLMRTKKKMARNARDGRNMCGRLKWSRNNYNN